MAPLGIALVRETTVFREYGPLAGSTARISYEYAPKVGSALLSRRTLDVDARHYLRIGSNGVFATRIRGFKSDGDFPGFMYFGGNADLRGYDFYQFVGQNVIYANAELRFPIIEAALTPIGVVGGVRGVFFAGAGGAWFGSQQPTINCNGVSGFQFASSSTTLCQVPTSAQTDALGNVKFTTNAAGQQVPTLNYTVQQVSGFRLQDGRASYGLGLETFLLGFPIHFDWSWRTLLNPGWENIVYGCTSIGDNGQCVSSAQDFRKPRFAVWIGYDF
jgi:outer membrane protein assembly factor BamA